MVPQSILSTDCYQCLVPVIQPYQTASRKVGDLQCQRLQQKVIKSEALKIGAGHCVVSRITVRLRPETALPSVVVIDFGQMGATAEADAVGILIV